MSSCQRCGETHSRPDAFLLTCRGCGKHWHHRCLMPPMVDQDLINLIRATNAGDTANALGNWTCRRCRKHASETPSATASSREQTVASESREGSMSLASSRGSVARDSTSTSSTILTANVRVKQEPVSTIETRPVDDQERNKFDQQEPSKASPVKGILVAERTKPSAAIQSPPDPTYARDTDVPMADAAPAGPIPREKKRSPHGSLVLPVKAARKFGSITSSEDDREVEMQVDPPPFSESTSRATSRVSQTPYLIWPPSARTASAPDEQGREVRSASAAAIQPQVASDEVDDDPEDLYGPPVERRVIRILPSLVEELRDQQRRVAAEKEKRRAPLAPDWILARHANDPQWKDSPTTEGRKRRKAIARKLGDTGLNVNELMGCFTVENWVREHKN